MDDKAELLKALMAVQAACPVIKKTAVVKSKNGQERYRFAPLSAIRAVVFPLLHENGLVVQFGSAPHHAGGVDGYMVSCTLSHTGTGASDCSEMFVPTSTGYQTNAAQDAGSAITFGKRYTLLNVLGLDAEDDNDGATAATPNAEWLVTHNRIARENFDAIGAIKDGFSGDVTIAAEAYAELTATEIRILFMAPSKGGLFTTEERKRAKEDQEFKDMVHAIRKDAGWYDRKENQL